MGTDDKHSLLFYCRRGFEKECAAEVHAHATARGIDGYIKARENAGHLFFIPHDTDSFARYPLPPLDYASLIFARQQILVAGPVNDLPVTDRISPLLDMAQQIQPPASRTTPGHFNHLWLETADTNEAKELSGFLRKFEVPLVKAAEQRGLLKNNSSSKAHDLHLHLFFLNSTTAWVGISHGNNASPWQGGIPRLRFPRSAPSRSTLKLEEAFYTFLRDPEKLLQPGMKAVDLGAAPGGWTWQLVKRHLRTTAIDNGSMDTQLMDSGLVEHLRVDGFRYRPAKTVDWMVCDMVEQPIRIAQLVANWLTEGACRQSIFNLKLPMKKRYEEVLRCRDLISEQLDHAGLAHEIRFKQMYHDREEVTGFVRLLQGY